MRIRILNLHFEESGKYGTGTYGIGPISTMYGSGPGSSNNSKKNLDSYGFVTSSRIFIFEILCKCSFKKK
jgi:hypothetical protein